MYILFLTQFEFSRPIIQKRRGKLGPFSQGKAFLQGGIFQSGQEIVCTWLDYFGIARKIKL